MNAQQFWYEGLGRFLHPGPDDPVAGPLLSLTRPHEHLIPGKSPMRLSKGAMALVTEDGAILKANVKPSKPLPPKVVHRDGTWRTSPNWLAEIIMSPPKGSFLVVEFGQQPYILEHFRLSTPDVITVVSASPYTFSRRAVVAGIEALENFPAQVRYEARRHIEHRFSEPEGMARRDANFAVLTQKHPGLSEAMDLTPPIGSVEFDMVRMVLAVREKDAKASVLEEA